MNHVGYNLLDITVMSANSSMMKLKLRKYFIARNVEYAGLEEEKIPSIVMDVGVVSALH